MTVTCLTHGPMKYRFDTRWYECVGFDGEGCDAPVAREEDLADVVSIPAVEVDRLVSHWRTLAGKSQLQPRTGGEPQ